MQTRRNLGTQIEAAASDYVAWMTSAATKLSFGMDFEAGSSAKEDWFATCTTGSGTTEIERANVWKPWFDLEPKSPDNLLWSVATGSDQGLLEYLAVAKIDKTYDIAKGGKELFKETPWYKHAQDVLHARLQRKNQAPAFNLATEKIAQSLAAQLTWLMQRDPQASHRVAAQMATVLMWRGDLILLPKTLQAKAKHFVRWHVDSWLGKPTAVAPLRLEPVAHDRER